ncbi:Suppressor of cytokine signaling 6, partial [Galemys pyrenaicus]
APCGEAEEDLQERRPSSIGRCLRGSAAAHENGSNSKEADFMIVQQPSLASDFGKDDSLFGSCHGKDMASCDINSEDEKGGENRSKSESLMGTLKRRLSAKQKQKGKGDEDAFSSSSAPMVFKDVWAQRSIRSTSLRSHHYSPMPWPLRPTNSEETCIKMEVRVKALVHSSGSSPALNGVRKDFHNLQAEPSCQEQNPSLKRSEAQNGDLYLHLDEHVPVVIGLMPQDYIQRGDVPSGRVAQLLSGQLFSHGGSAFSEDESQVDQDLVVAPEMFVNPSELQRAEWPRRPLGGELRCHLNFDPNSAPGVARVYDSVQSSGSMVVTSLTEEQKKLAKQGWYWGPITPWEAEGKLANVPDGSFLVRDSSDDRYLLSLSFQSHGKTLHTQIEHSNGRFSFLEQPNVEGHTSIVDLIEHSIRDSENGAFCYSRSRLPGSAAYRVRLTNPVSRFMQVRSLQYLCRFVIRQYTRIDLIQKLPLPNKMKDYLQEKHY